MSQIGEPEKIVTIPDPVPEPKTEPVPDYIPENWPIPVSEPADA